MATITLEYDGRNNAIKQLIQVLFTLGAKETGTDTKEEQSKMVKESLTTAFDKLYTGLARKKRTKPIRIMFTFDYLPEFERRSKALTKKYRSFVDDYNTFLDEPEQNPFSGTLLGNSTYMYRMSIALKGKGKSSGARVITYNVQ